MIKQVFLGGSCGSTTWRKDVAIPRMEAAGVAYHNPQTKDRTPISVERTSTARRNSEVLLFVIDRHTRAVTDMLEAVEYAHAGRHVVVCFEDIRDGDVIDGQAVTGSELRDLNRARAHCRDSILRAPLTRTHISESIEDAVEWAIWVAKGQA